MSFNLDEYVDVAERIKMFAAKFPEGSLQGEGYFVRGVEENIIGYHYVARAYRNPADERPGVGTAFEPIPGKTQFTRDSEVQNAETAAWGRAIVALGFETRKIASRQEVQARQGSPAANGAGAGSAGVAQGNERHDGEGAGGNPVASNPDATPASNFSVPNDVQAELDRKQASSVPNQDGGVPEEVPLTFGKYKEKNKKIGDLVDSDSGYLQWLAGEKFEPKTKEQRRAKAAAQTVLGQPLTFHGDAPDDGIPF